jgi:hypothetical protein
MQSIPLLSFFEEDYFILCMMTMIDKYNFHLSAYNILKGWYAIDR